MNIHTSRRRTVRTAVFALVAAGGLSLAGVGISNADTSGPAPAARSTAVKKREGSGVDVVGVQEVVHRGERQPRY